MNTVCLPEFGEEDDFDREDCHAMGWGKDRFGDNQYNTFLRSVPTHMVDSDTCQEGLRSTHLRLLK